ncbi:MAG: winged helix-turn-helix domain-containing protein [Bacteroidales bacterium]|nr:winged helix-turn-helix domain-containing protein [Bacteroidales bacterium]
MLPSLSDIQRKIIFLVKENPQLTMNEIGSKIGIGRTKTYQNIKVLREKGFLNRKGRKSDGEWTTTI